MNTRKNIAVYFLWFCFVILALAGLIFNVGGYCISTYHTRFGLTSSIVCVYIVVLLIIYLLCRVIVEKIHDKRKNDRAFKIKNDEYHKSDEKKKNPVKVILPALVLFAGIAKMAHLVMKNVPLNQEATIYVRNALLTDQSPLQFDTHGLTDLYTRILRGIFLLFGNQTFAVLTFHMILYFVVLLAIFVTIQRLIGFVCGIATMIAFIALPVSTEYCLTFTPELLFLFLYLLGLSAIGQIVEHFKNGTFSSPKRCIWVIFFGLYIGFMTYLDIFGITLLFYIFWLFLLKEPKEKHRNIGYIILFEIIGIVDALIITAAVLELTNTVSVVDDLNQLFYVYFGQISLNTSFMMLIPDCTVWGSIAILTIGFLVAPAFLVEKEDRCTPYIFSFFILSLMKLFQVDSKINLELMNAFFWCVLAGVVVHGLLCFDAEESSDESEDIEELEKPEEIEELEEIEVSVVNGNERAALPGEPLPNPMQIPKKHEKKSNDYKIDVPEEQMKFDFDVSDDSDFDLM